MLDWCHPINPINDCVLQLIIQFINHWVRYRRWRNSSWFWRLCPSIVWELDKPVFLKFSFVVDMTKLYQSFCSNFLYWSTLSMLSVCIALHCISFDCIACEQLTQTVSQITLHYITFICFNINLNIFWCFKFN